ncbi:MAG: hypothetical protein ABI333_17390 [bacterium]
MKRQHSATLLAAALTTLALTAAGCGKSKPAARDGCAKDTDCKGERVCYKGSCVPPQKAQGDKQGSAAVALKPTAPGATPSGPGATPPPGSSLTPPNAPPPGGASPSDVRVCIGAKCVNLSGGSTSGTRDMMAMFDMFQKLLMSGLTGGHGASQPKMKVCVGTRCVVLDKNILRNPMALIRLFSNISPKLLQNFFQHRFGQTPGWNVAPPGANPGTPGAPSTPDPRSGPKALKSFQSLLQAGQQAIGQVAEIPGLIVTSVTDTRLVLEGPGQEMVVLRIPTAQRTLLPQLRITTKSIKVRFRVLSRPVGKLVHGELLGTN